MPSAENNRYQELFIPGQRVGIGIFLPDKEIFRDWGIIEQFDGDFLAVRITRKQLPEGAVLETGSTIMVRAGKDGEGYSCTAIVIGNVAEELVPLRLTGELVTDNQREFFRVDVFLPLTFVRCPEPNIEEVGKRWEEMERKRKYHERWEESIDAEVRAQAAANLALLPPELIGEPRPIAANISGNGLKIRTSDSFQPGDLLELKLYIPAPQRHVVELIAEVVHATPLPQDEGDAPQYSTAMRYKFINRQDQDKIIAFTRQEEREQIQLMGSRHLVEAGEEVLTPRQWFFHIVRQVIGTLVTLYIIWYVSMTLVNYQKYGPRNYIQKTFDQQIMQYVRKLSAGN